MLNKVQIIGRVGKDPELKYLTNGDAVCNMTVATSETWKDKNGEKKEATEWHRVTMFRKLGEIAGQYLKKGSLVYIEGKIKTREYTDKDGVKRYVTEITADEMKMLGKKDDNVTPSAPPAPRPQPSPSMTTSAGPFGDVDDIPFLFNGCSVRDTMGLPTAYWRGRYGKEMSIMRANETDF